MICHKFRTYVSSSLENSELYLSLGLAFSTTCFEIENRFGYFALPLSQGAELVRAAHICIEELLPNSLLHCIA
jgi:hypothetical protein